MKRRFSGNELYKIRNLIPVDTLIRDHLNIPSKVSQGYFRFLCPLCKEFQTATNPKTNLARCFLCKENFNPIDLVMTVKGMGFVETVNYLNRFLPDTSGDSGALNRRQALNKLVMNISERVSIR